MRNTLAIGLLLLSGSAALAGHGGSTTLINSAVASGSVDAIVAELERAEYLPSSSAIAPVRALVDHSSYRVRQAAGWWLTRRGVRTEVIADMTARLVGTDPVLARNAADVLGGLRDITTLPALMTFVQNPLDDASGAAAANAIESIGSPQALPALKAALASPSATVRAAVATAIRGIRAPVGARVSTDASTLVPLFTDSDAGVRTQAIYSAGYVQDHAVVTALSQVATTDQTASVRKAAVWALGEIGDSAGRAALTAALTDADPLVRSVAVGAISRLK